MRLTSAAPLPQLKAEALAARTPAQALEAPTIASIAKAYGIANVATEVHAIATAGMQYFAPGRRMTPEQIELFVDAIVEEYPHESLADINVFIRACAKSKYDRGEFFAAVDVPRLMGWWREYLGEKADERERVERQRRSELQKASNEALAAVPDLPSMIDRIANERAARDRAESERMSLAKLRDRVKMYTNEQLRDTWKDWGAEGRSILVKEADRRGLLKAAMDKATKDTNTTAA